MSTNQLENFAHQARNCVGEECQKIIRDMVYQCKATGRNKADLFNLARAV
ncbi:hypothetical protein [Proteus vulgaris]|nr:hypothetical protein [Proteus vulgaris]